MLIIRAPIQVKTFLDYTLCIVFEEWLGLEFKTNYQDINRITISYKNSREKIILNCKFLTDLTKNKLVNLDQIKNRKLIFELLNEKLKNNLKIRESYIPVLFGLPNVHLNENLEIDFDLFGTIFFMLSRFEELNHTDVDEHKRFIGKKSIAFNLGFLDRPIVDEYVEFIWSCIKISFPVLTRKKSDFRFLLSCDVDRPFDPTVKSLPFLAQTCVKDIVKRRSISEAIKRIKRYKLNNKGVFDCDPFYTFDWYMCLAEKNSLKVTFFFLPSSLEPKNGSYSLKDKGIKKLLLEINERGHEIGVHGTYQSYNQGEKIKKHKELLQQVLCDLDIKQKLTGNRQHYLRWDNSITPDLIEDAGFKYDSTGGFADHAGFRFGTCKEFSMWSWRKMRKLNAKQRPLVVMECSVLDNCYMGMSADKAEVYLQKLKTKCREMNGDYTLLWHNSALTKSYMRDLFIKTLQN